MYPDTNSYDLMSALRRGELERALEVAKIGHGVDWHVLCESPMKHLIGEKNPISIEIMRELARCALLEIGDVERCARMCIYYFTTVPLAIEKLRVLVGIRGYDINKPDLLGKTPLQLAVTCPNLVAETVDVLIRAGARVGDKERADFRQFASCSDPVLVARCFDLMSFEFSVSTYFWGHPYLADRDGDNHIRYRIETFAGKCCR